MSEAERGAEVKAQPASRLLMQLKAAGRVWLFLDYDGTLADFAPTPAEVLPDAELIGLLDRMACNPALRVVILSGRRLADLRQLVPLGGVFLAGTYGIELQTPDGDLIYALDEAEVRPALAALKPRLEALLTGRRGFYLEDKGWSLAVHARFADPAEAVQVLEQARRLMQPVSEGAEPLRLLGGDRFLEIGPRAANKGDTVTFLLERDPWLDADLVYLGDDDKDEEAFAIVLQRGGAAVRVGPAERLSLAHYRLSGPDEARRWLEELA